MAGFDPTRPDFSPYGFSCVRWTPAKMPRCDRHNEIELNLLEEGKLIYLIGGRKVTVPAGRLTAFWAGVPHQVLDFERLSGYFVATIPLVWFLQWRLPEPFLQTILHGEAVMEPDEQHLTADRQQFERWSEDLRSDSEERRQVSLLEIEARLRRLALGARADIVQHSWRKSPRVVEYCHLDRAEEIACFIAQNYTRALTAEMIGEHVGLHPNYAMALFQQTFGTTLSKYITEHRLSHAQRLLVTTKDLIVNVASHSGFGSLSRFNAAFRQSFNCTPRQYRRSHSVGVFRDEAADMTAASTP